MNEKYIPLYRKYRPQTLEEIVGQAHVKKALTNAIELNKVAHAYLFTGPRGTGKTSTARILAKSLNCVEGPTIHPCGKCPSCLDIINSTPIDVIEIDAASNRSVNDAQNILEKIQYAPVNGKYKIYIIDEVHMLTTQAFNALLKTLEEPPENVVFILATTEVHKVLDTIKSRCQRFDFKRITTEDIVNHLKYVAKQENINIEDDALLTIAKNAAGGMRDSLALLDQLSVLDTDHAITTEDINMLLGRLSFDVLNRLSQCIIHSQPNDAIEIFNDIYNSGNEPTQILLNLLNYFKNMLIVKNCKSELVLELTQTTESQAKTLKEQADELETQQIVFLIDKIQHYIQELKMTTNQHLWLEVAMIDLANLAENSKLIELQNRISRLEGGEVQQEVVVHNYKTPPAPVQKPSMKPASAPSHTPVVSEVQHVAQEVKEEPKPQVYYQTAAQPKQMPQIEEPKVQEIAETPQEAFPAVNTSGYEHADLVTMWHELLANITSTPTRELLKQLGKPIEITPENVVIAIKQEIFVKQWSEETKKKTIVDAVDKLFSQKGSNVVIRQPLPSDAQVNIASTPKQLVAKPASKSEPVAQDSSNEEPLPQKKPEQEVSMTTKVDVEKPTSDPDMVELVEVEVPDEKTESKIESETVSDQVRMVKDLFEGKIVE